MTAHRATNNPINYGTDDTQRFVTSNAHHYAGSGRASAWDSEARKLSGIQAHPIGGLASRGLSGPRNNAQNTVSFEQGNQNNPYFQPSIVSVSTKAPPKTISQQPKGNYENYQQQREDQIQSIQNNPPSYNRASQDTYGAMTARRGTEGIPQDVVDVFYHDSPATGNSPAQGSPVQNQSRSPSPKRHLPIQNKKKIFNEWGAVIRHHDELADALSKAEYVQKKDMHANYKQGLDQQRQDAYQRVIDARKRDMDESKMQLEARESHDRRQFSREAQRKQEIIEQAAGGIRGSLNEVEKLKAQKKQLDEQDKQMHRNRYNVENDQMIQDIAYQRLNKSRHSRQYLDDLKTQERLKKQVADKERKDGLIYAQLEVQQQEKHEQTRKDHFNRVNQFQINNEQKFQQFANYKGDHTKEYAKRDEMNHLKSIDEMKRARDRKDMTEAQRMALMKSDQRAGLELQMKEKEAAKYMQKLTEANYAKQTQMLIHAQNEQENRKREKALQVKEQYNQSINSQIKTDKQRKKYDNLMSEHDRRVNDRDMKAYQEQDTTTINTLMVPGLGNHYAQMQKGYMHRQLNAGPNSRSANKMIASTQEVSTTYGQANPIQINTRGSVEQTPYNQVGTLQQSTTPRQQSPYQGGLNRSASLNQVGNADAGLEQRGLNRNRSSLALAGGNLMQNQASQQRLPSSYGQTQFMVNTNPINGMQSYAQQQVDQTTLNKVVRNMQHPKALQFRANTGNRGYGFVQKVNQEVPQHKLHQSNARPEDGFADYKFSVAGNHAL